MPSGPRLSVVIVTWNSRDEVVGTVRALRSQLAEGDELVLVDNASADGTPEAVLEVLPETVLVRNAENVGFDEGCRIGAERAAGDLLVFLNPDAAPAAGFRDAICAPLARDDGWSAWMALVTDRGETINTSGGVLHFTGIGWAGRAGEPIATAPGAPREVGFASGACLAVPAAVWRDAGGFPPGYFMYHEDVELSLRLRLWGGRIGIEPAARVDHVYDFHKGGHKWRRLEANRWATIVRTYPAALLAALAPVLVLTELAILAASVAGGWAGQKLLAWVDLARALPRLLRERRAVQARRVIPASEFAEHLTSDLSSPYLGAAARARPVRMLLGGYWSLVLRILR